MGDPLLSAYSAVVLDEVGMDRVYTDQGALTRLPFHCGGLRPGVALRTFIIAVNSCASVEDSKNFIRTLSWSSAVLTSPLNIV